MTSVVTAVAVAIERTKAAVATTALMRKVGAFMQIIPATARRRVKTFLFDLTHLQNVRDNKKRGFLSNRCA
jgi:hypothetical protein